MRSVLLDELCDVVGYEATESLRFWFGGRKLYVPKQPSADHPLRNLLGDVAFERLVDAFAAVALDMPKPRSLDLEQRDRRIAEQLAAGETFEAIAAVHGITTQRVGQIRTELIERGWLAFVSGSAKRGRPAKGTRVQIFSERAGLSANPHPLENVVQVLASWARPAEPIGEVGLDPSEAAAG